MQAGGNRGRIHGLYTRRWRPCAAHNARNNANIWATQPARDFAASSKYYINNCVHSTFSLRSRTRRAARNAHNLCMYGSAHNRAEPKGDQTAKRLARIDEMQIYCAFVQSFRMHQPYVAYMFHIRGAVCIYDNMLRIRVASGDAARVVVRGENVKRSRQSTVGARAVCSRSRE